MTPSGNRLYMRENIRRRRFNRGYFFNLKNLRPVVKSTRLRKWRVAAFPSLRSKFGRVRPLVISDSLSP
jgi:hypothetical protein